MKAEQLNLEKLGLILLNVAPASMQVGHKWVKSTIKDDTIPVDHLELEFVRDLFTLETDRIIDKWYDGEENAASFISQSR